MEEAEEEGGAAVFDEAAQELAELLAVQPVQAGQQGNTLEAEMQYLSRTNQT